MGQTARRYLATAVLGLVSIAPRSSEAQVLRYEPFTRWMVAWSGGVSNYVGDQEAERLSQAALGPLLGGEVFHRFNAVVGLGVGASVLRNPRLNEPDLFRSSMGAVLRITQPGTRRLSPYAHAGLHYLIGGSRGGSGPTAGAGANLRITRTFSLFAQADVHFVYPGDVLDDSQDAGHFDALGLASFGIRITDIRGFFGNRQTLNITAVRHTPSPRAGVPIQFIADVNSPAPRTQYVWDFGDGETGAGNPVNHTFLREGVYRVVISADNRDGAAIRYMAVDVGTPGEPLALETPRGELAPPRTTLPVPDRAAAGERRRRAPATASRPSSEETEDAAESDAVQNPPNEPHPPLPISGYTWVVGSRRSLADARSLAQPYLDGGARPLIFASTVRGETWYRVTLGQYGTRAQADRARSRLPGRTPSDAWVAFVDAQVPIMGPAAPGTPDGLSTDSIQHFDSPERDEPNERTGLTLVVASPSALQSARELAARLRASGLDATVRTSAVDGLDRHRVTVGLYRTRDEAERARSTLPAELARDAWILNLGRDP